MVKKVVRVFMPHSLLRQNHRHGIAQRFHATARLSGFKKRQDVA